MVFTSVYRVYHGKMGCTSPCLNISSAAMYAATRIGALRASHLDDLGIAKKNVASATVSLFPRLLSPNYHPRRDEYSLVS